MINIPVFQQACQFENSPDITVVFVEMLFFVSALCPL